MSAEKLMDLKPDGKLLDPHFDGYKLSLDSLPIYSVGIESGADSVQLNDSQYSFQHVKAFGAPNLLHLDPWHQETIYVIDQKWNVQQIAFTSENRFVGPSSVFHIPDGASQRSVPGRVSTSVAFPSNDLVVIGDGAGKLLIIDTGPRGDSGAWKACYNDEVLGRDIMFSVVHAKYHRDNENQILECILMHVDKTGEEGEGQNETSAFVTKLEWLTFTSADRKTWTLDRSRRLFGGSSPDFVTIDKEAVSLFICSMKPFKFEFDSLNPVEEEAACAQTPVEPSPSYTWYQTDEEVELQFALPMHANRSDILFKLTHDHLSLGLKNGRTLLEGDLGGRVDVETSTWTTGQHSTLELTLTKVNSDKWDIVVCGDDSGEMVFSPVQAAAIHERLAQLTSDNANADPMEDSQPPYNSQQLEECDTFPDETAAMTRWDGESHKLTHKVNLSSHQVLFTCDAAPDQMPMICLRHDVDGIVWSPSDVISPNYAPLDHISTFNALGYVQASKQQRKYATCAPDFSLAVLSDNVRHVYIYRQPSAITSPIRNRKTGRQVAAVAKQQLVTLDSVDTVLGLKASVDKVYVLAGSTMFVVKTQ